MTVGIIMGSKSDWPTMQHAAEMLDLLGVKYETKVVSAHRTPHLLAEYAESAKDRGIKVIIGGAGGAAPKGIAVGTLAIGTAGAANAGLLAAQIIGTFDEKIQQNIEEFRKNQTQTILNNPNPAE